MQVDSNSFLELVKQNSKSEHNSSMPDHLGKVQNRVEQVSSLSPTNAHQRRDTGKATSQNGDFIDVLEIVDPRLAMQRASLGTTSQDGGQTLNVASLHKQSVVSSPNSKGSQKLMLHTMGMASLTVSPLPTTEEPFKALNFRKMTLEISKGELRSNSSGVNKGTNDERQNSILGQRSSDVQSQSKAISKFQQDSSSLSPNQMKLKVNPKIQE